MKIEKFNINGSKIAAYKVSGVRMISVSIAIKAGAWYENKDQAGYFHLLEHLVLNGTKKFKSFKEVTEYKEKYGISNNAATSGRWMEFWFDFPDIYLKESMELVEEVLFNSTINFENIKNELSIVEQEYFDSWSSPYKKFNVEIGKKLAGKECNLVNEVLGSPETFKKASQDKLRKIYKDFFKAERMCWGFSGNYKINELKEVLKKIIPENKEIKKVEEMEIKNFQPEMGKILFENKIEQPYIRIIWQIPAICKLPMSKRYGLNTFNYLLGDGSNSALFTKIRQDKGLVYRINSDLWDWPNVSHLEIYASTDKSKIDTVILESQKILDELINKPIDGERLKRALNYLDLKTLMSYSSPSKIAGNLAFSLLFDNDVYTPKKIIEMAHRAKIENIQAWLKKYVDSKKQLVAVMISNEGSQGNNNGK